MRHVQRISNTLASWLLSIVTVALYALSVVRQSLMDKLSRPIPPAENTTYCDENGCARVWTKGKWELAQPDIEKGGKYYHLIIKLLGALQVLALAYIIYRDASSEWTSLLSFIFTH